MKLNSAYLMELVLPQVDRLYANEAQFERHLPIDAAKFFDPHADGGRVIDTIMFELFNRRRKDFEAQYVAHRDRLEEIAHDDDEARQADAVWSLFGNRVDRASLYLHALRPDEFVFYRKMDIEEAIFESLDALGSGYPELDFEFSAVPPQGRADYEKLNAGLQTFARRFWPDASTRYQKLMLLLYWVLPELMRPQTSLHRYWLGMAKDPDNIREIQNLKPGESTEWSATYQVEKGDIYMVYCTSPVKGIAAIFRAADRSWCDPMGGWEGHWVKMDKVADGAVSFAAMKADPLLREWGPVVRQFQFTTLEQVPPAIFNRIRELFIDQGMAALAVDAAPLAEFYASGEFAKESDFEEQRIKPLLADMGFAESQDQYLVKLWTGSKMNPCRIDFLVRDERKRVVSLFEDKQTIKGYRHAEDAYNQARSYALQLRLRSFVVAAPEGVKFYGRHRTARDFPAPESPLFEATWSGLGDASTLKRFRDLLLRYAPKDE